MIIPMVETRPIALDHDEESDELELNHPSRVILHLKRPNISLECDAETVKNPDALAHICLNTFQTRYKLNGRCFDRKAPKGRRVDLWGRWLDLAAVGIQGKFFKADGVEVPADQALVELRK